MPRKWFLYHKWWIGSLQTHVSWHFLGIQRIDSPLKYSKALVGRSSSFSDGGHEQGGFWQESRIFEEIEMLCWSERWWFQSFKHLFIIFTFFITTWENDPIWLILVSTGSKPPPSDTFWCFFLGYSSVSGTKSRFDGWSLVENWQCTLTAKKGDVTGRILFVVSMPLGSNEKHGNWGILRLLATTPDDISCL